jgi:hypothetical protein
VKSAVKVFDVIAGCEAIHGLPRYARNDKYGVIVRHEAIHGLLRYARNDKYGVIARSAATWRSMAVTS